MLLHACNIYPMPQLNLSYSPAACTSSCSAWEEYALSSNFYWHASCSQLLNAIILPLLFKLLNQFTSESNLHNPTQGLAPDLDHLLGSMERSFIKDHQDLTQSGIVVRHPDNEQCFPSIV